jgi:hypothetical protein
MRLPVHPINNAIAALTDIPNNCAFSWHYPNVPLNYVAGTKQRRLHLHKKEMLF